jgi:hypothetical protein
MTSEQGVAVAIPYSRIEDAGCFEQYQRGVPHES